MREDRIKIGIFTASLSMMSHLKNMPSVRNDLSIIFSDQGLDDAVRVGQQMERDGVEVIMSRRGTANMLRESLEIPVLSFPQSGMDMMSALNTASELGTKILLPTFRRKLEEIEFLINLLKADVLQMVYFDTKSLEDAVINGSKQGCDVVVGGSFTVKIARHCGLKTVELQTPKEMIDATIENAKSVAQAARKQHEESLKYQTIINSTSEGIIAVNKEGVVTTMNLAALRMLKLGEEKLVVGNNIVNYIDNSFVDKTVRSNEAIIDSIEKYNDKSYVFNHIPIISNYKTIGVVSTFQDVNEIMKTENEVRKNFTKGLSAKYTVDNLIHSSKQMDEIVAKARQFSKTESTILITGETGTGKEILAQSIHKLGNRSSKPFVSINCAALPENLLESELFGYEEGAFTGSRKGGKSGLFELAHTGTIFLDEISAAPNSVQMRLLRVLQEREVMRLGSDRIIPVNVRVIAAANTDLIMEVKNNTFRKDLYFRLNILNINIPPLKNRIEDIPLLVKHFIEKFSENNGTKVFQLPSLYYGMLADYSWPGNVRQLRNFVERLVLLSQPEGSLAIFEELYAELLEYSDSMNTDSDFYARTVQVMSIQEKLKQQRDENEAKFIKKALQDSRFNKNEAAKKLNMSRTTLWRKIKELGLYE